MHGALDKMQEAHEDRLDRVTFRLKYPVALVTRFYPRFPSVKRRSRCCISWQQGGRRSAAMRDDLRIHECKNSQHPVLMNSGSLTPDVSERSQRLHQGPRSKHMETWTTL